MRRFLTATAVVVGLILGGLALAEAAIPDTQGVIHACRHNVTGALRVIDSEAGQDCLTSETALTWNQEGPEGPAGPAGPPGPAGNVGMQVVSEPVPHDSCSPDDPDWDPDAIGCPPSYTLVSCPDGKYGVQVYFRPPSGDPSPPGGWQGAYDVDAEGRITGARFLRPEHPALEFVGYLVCING